MAYPPLVNRFTFDPPPAGIDPLVSEWMEAQLRRIQTQMIALIQDSEMALPELPRWNDVAIPATAIRVTGATGEPDYAADGGLLFDNVTVEQAAVLYQLPHTWVAGTPAQWHIHWHKMSAAAGDVEWEYRYRVWNNGEVAPAWSSWLTKAGRAYAIGSTIITTIDYFDEIDMTGIEKSGWLSVQFRRNTASSIDSFADDAKVLGVDPHLSFRGDGTYQIWGPW